MRFLNELRNNSTIEWIGFNCYNAVGQKKPALLNEGDRTEWLPYIKIFRLIS